MTLHFLIPLENHLSSLHCPPLGHNEPETETKAVELRVCAPQPCPTWPAELQAGLWVCERTAELLSPALEAAAGWRHSGDPA